MACFILNGNHSSYLPYRYGSNLPAVHQRSMFRACSLFQSCILRGERIAGSQGQFQIRCIVGRKPMLIGQRQYAIKNTLDAFSIHFDGKRPEVIRCFRCRTVFVIS